MKQRGLQTVGQVKAYLASKGIPKSTVDAIRETLVDDALRNGEGMRGNRLYSIIAYTCYHELGWGRTRTPRFLHQLDDNFAKVTNDELSWTEIMEDIWQNLSLRVECIDERDRELWEYDPERDGIDERLVDPGKYKNAMRRSDEE